MRLSFSVSSIIRFPRPRSCTSWNSYCGYEITLVLLWLWKICNSQMLAPAVFVSDLRWSFVGMLLQMPLEWVLLILTYWETPHKNRFERSIVLEAKRIFSKRLDSKKMATSTEHAAVCQKSLAFQLNKISCLGQADASDYTHNTTLHNNNS